MTGDYYEIESTVLEHHNNNNNNKNHYTTSPLSDIGITVQSNRRHALDRSRTYTYMILSTRDRIARLTSDILFYSRDNVGHAYLTCNDNSDGKYIDRHRSNKTLAV
jgi:hypothetical protein